MNHARFKIKAELESRGGASAFLKSAGDAVIIKRGFPRWLLLKCPCGCGEEIPINLDPRAGKAWRLYSTQKNGTTLFPSVWRDTGCKSHFVLWRDQILMYGPRYRSGNSPSDKFDFSALSRRVLEVWPTNSFVHYADVADALNEIPWDVLEACQRLTKNGLMIEASGEERGTFKRISA